MAMVEKASGPICSSATFQKPKCTLDRFTAISMICLKPFFEKENDRLAINEHRVILQRSQPVEVPIWGGPVVLPGIGQLDWQAASRFIGRNSREELSDIIIAIEEGLHAYLEHKPLQAMLPLLKEGLETLIRFYKTLDNTDNTATTVLRLGVNKTNDAIEFKNEPAKYRTKHPILGISQELETIRSEIIASWSPDEIAVVASLLLLASKKRGKNENCLPEVQALLIYLETKQGQNFKNLDQEQKLLNS